MFTGLPAASAGRAIGTASGWSERSVHSRCTAWQLRSEKAVLRVAKRSAPPGLQLMAWIQDRDRYTVSGAQGSMWGDQQLTWKTENEHSHPFNHANHSKTTVCFTCPCVFLYSHLTVRERVMMLNMESLVEALACSAWTSSRFTGPRAASMFSELSTTKVMLQPRLPRISGIVRLNVILLSTSLYHSSR